MMGRLNQDQGQLFYSFCLEDVVPADHRVREIAAVLDLSWVRAELASWYQLSFDANGHSGNWISSHFDAANSLELSPLLDGC